MTRRHKFDMIYDGGLDIRHTTKNNTNRKSFLENECQIGNFCVKRAKYF